MVIQFFYQPIDLFLRNIGPGSAFWKVLSDPAIKHQDAPNKIGYQAFGDALMSRKIVPLV